MNEPIWGMAKGCSIELNIARRRRFIADGFREYLRHIHDIRGWLGRQSAWHLYGKEKSMTERYLEPTEESGRALFSRGIVGEVVMLNLLRFRAEADYSTSPTLVPHKPISGRQAYQKYIDHTVPFLEATGGSIVLLGKGGSFLIGPQDETWDCVLLVRQNSLSDFLAFASDAEYLKGIGHRTAALEDSRLLPLVEFRSHSIVDDF